LEGAGLEAAPSRDRRKINVFDPRWRRLILSELDVVRLRAIQTDI
jgi:hypothetical protein